MLLRAVTVLLARGADGPILFRHLVELAKDVNAAALYDLDPAALAVRLTAGANDRREAIVEAEMDLLALIGPDCEEQRRRRIVSCGSDFAAQTGYSRRLEYLSQKTMTVSGSTSSALTVEKSTRQSSVCKAMWAW